MEHAQRFYLRVSTWSKSKEVLILILMEHAQRLTARLEQVDTASMGLNPYFNGTCSKILVCGTSNAPHSVVLILILMEHAQR